MLIASLKLVGEHWNMKLKNLFLVERKTLGNLRKTLYLESMYSKDYTYFLNASNAKSLISCVISLILISLMFIS